MIGLVLANGAFGADEATDRKIDALVGKMSLKAKIHVVCDLADPRDLIINAETVAPPGAPQRRESPPR